MEIISFCAGTMFCYTHNLFICLVLCAASLIKKNYKIILVFIGAILLGELHEYIHRPTPKYDENDNKIISLCGQIISIPEHNSYKSQFYLQTNKFKKILVNCYKNCEYLNYKQIITGELRLRKPRNFKNPGGFDYINFLRAKHTYWLGSLRNYKIISEASSPKTNLLILRTKLSQRLSKLNLDARTIAMLKALSIGIANDLTQDDWALFRNTGTIHLLVISGAHIGFITSLIYLFSKFVWSRVGLSLVAIPSQKLASIFALLAATIYAALAGFSVSVQRALIACSFILAKNFIQVKFSSWQAWRSGILVTLLLEPHYVLIPGFYLSFIAVAILLITNKYFLHKKIFKSLLIQAGCLIGLMPFTIYWFNYGSINSFVANIIAIPLVGFIIVPLCLVCLWCAWFLDSEILNYPLYKLIDLLFKYLIFVDSNIKINISQYLSIYSVSIILIIIGMLLILSVKAVRTPIFCSILALHLTKNTQVKYGNARIDVLDVGQGLAVFISTAHHQLLFDTGGKFYLGKDLGELVIIPYLQTLGLKSLDMLIISHPDLDHRGGLTSIMAKYSVKKLVVNNPSFYKQGFTCHGYPAWQWDGVDFEFLNTGAKVSKRNNDSCVLKIKGSKASILLTGDIEHQAENSLVKNYTTKLQADYLLVPHHGSRTSSSKDFLKAVRPKLAILSYGLHNRYKFPHQSVINTYKLSGIKIQSTAKHGMISINLNHNV